MKHKNRTIRRLRKECARLRQQASEDNQKYDALLCEVVKQANCASPRAALDYVQRLTQRNLNQCQQIRSCERENNRLAQQVAGLQDDRVIHSVIIGLLGLIVLGFIVYHLYC